MTMYRSLRRILFPSCHLLLIAISLFLTLPGPSESAQEWKSHKHDFSPTISDGPFYVPFLSRWLGLMPPLTFDDEELVIARLQDYFLSKPEQSWEAYQPMWRVSYTHDDDHMSQMMLELFLLSFSLFPPH